MATIARRPSRVRSATGHTPEAPRRVRRMRARLKVLAAPLAVDREPALVARCDEIGTAVAVDVSRVHVLVPPRVAIEPRKPPRRFLAMRTWSRRARRCPAAVAVHVGDVDGGPPTDGMTNGRESVPSR